VLKSLFNASTCGLCSTKKNACRSLFNLKAVL
jgi:hypothetical protein